ncbi:hypothetical protein COM13_19020 [Bacillus pseudomycoides]|uniref:hypothetical protein n=1 Tax=Bacillus TaxID=1386 RepID=UPI000374C367|nr:MULTISPECIES: hypothetical protein [Bacillus]PDX99243.1 hypothetical protein COO07_17630 [Bacillus pseudomycoides]PEK73719.1 hypothetical protein CN597_28430 [Bacillus pseudomycoides]PEN08099.1 hypothetical protein CN640_13775 [Bacillus pseudomycoides]PGB87558.1 hypothetical protein COM13_19020 [Bacillus pseudomycoides]PGS04514.1 hypothetical protein COC54_12560 [Bacillus pseudomycoides]
MNTNQYSMENCLFEMIKLWLKKEVNLEVNDSFLYLACCNIGFEYESQKVQTGSSFPKINILQKMDKDMLSKHLRIHITENNSSDTEKVWYEIEKELLANEMIVVRGGVSLLPELENKRTVTYFAIQDYDQEKGIVYISSVYFSGPITVDLLKKIMYETIEFEESPNNWLKFQLNGIPKFGNKKLYNLLLKNLEDPNLIEKSMNNMKNFIDDFATIKNLKYSLSKIIITYINDIMFNPLAPPSTRKQLYMTIDELYHAGYLNKACLNKCEKLAMEWKKVKLNFAKEAMKPSDNFIQWVSNKLVEISELEYDTLNEIILSTKGAKV